MRARWSAPIRRYWKISEQMMVKYCDLAICDSVNIEKYIHECYDGKGIKGKNPKTTFIAYGADLTLSKLADDDEKLVNWYKEKGLTKKDYYLVVGRFVPENSFEVMIREFMKSKSKKNFAIITNVNKRMVLGVIVTQIVSKMMQLQQLHQHQIEVNPFRCRNLRSVQPTLRHLIDFITVQHQVGCESVMLIKKDVLILNGQKLVQSMQVHKQLMLQIMSECIAAHHLLCLFVQLAIDKNQRLIKIE